MKIMEKTSCVVDNAQLEFFFDYNANGDLSEIHCSEVLTRYWLLG